MRDERSIWAPELLKMRDKILYFGDCYDFLLLAGSGPPSAVAVHFTSSLELHGVTMLAHKVVNLAEHFIQFYLDMHLPFLPGELLERLGEFDLARHAPPDAQGIDVAAVHAFREDEANRDAMPGSLISESYPDPEAPETAFTKSCLRGAYRSERLLHDMLWPGRHTLRLREPGVVNLLRQKYIHRLYEVVRHNTESAERTWKTWKK